MSRNKKALKIIGLLILASGIILNLANLNGMLKDKDRAEMLRWAMESKKGIPIENKAAKLFFKNFPPPQDRVEDLTHVTKTVVRQPGGGLPMMVCINYMHSDGTRTGCVASIEELRDWSNETPYPWLAWLLTLFGFCQVLLSTFFEFKEHKSAGSKVLKNGRCL